MVKSCFGKEQDAHQFGGTIPVATEAYLEDLCIACLGQDILNGCEVREHPEGGVSTAAGNEVWNVPGNLLIAAAAWKRKRKDLGTAHSYLMEAV